MSKFAEQVGMKEIDDETYDLTMKKADALIKELSDEEIDATFASVLWYSHKNKLAELLNEHPNLNSIIGSLAVIPLIVEKQLRQKKRNASSSPDRPPAA